MSTPAHIFKTARRQLRKIRHRGPRSDTERRLLASADSQREQGLGWRYDGFADYSTTDLFEILRARALIDLNSDKFKRDALEAGSPTKLASHWESSSSAEGKWRDLPNLLARELWRRLLPDFVCAEVIADKVDELLEHAEVADSKLQLWDRAADELVASCYYGGSANPTLFQSVKAESGSDLIGWMEELLQMLVSSQNGSKAISLCNSFLQLLDENIGKSIRAQLSNIFLEMGRREEALAEIEALISKHPADPLVLEKASEIFEKLGDIERSRKYRSRSTAIAASEKPTSPSPVQIVSEKNTSTGPNDKCPCGSGKKYKRCHGLPS